MTQPEVRLPAEAEALLTDWPLPGKPDEHWERSRLLILEKIQGEPAAVDQGLLDVPVLGGEHDEEPPVSAPRLVEGPEASKAFAAARTPASIEDDDNESLLALARSVAPRTSGQSRESARDLLLSATQARRSPSLLDVPPHGETAQLGTQNELPSIIVKPLSSPVASPTPIAKHLVAAPASPIQEAPSAEAKGRKTGMAIGFLAAAAMFGLFYGVQSWGPAAGEEAVVAHAPPTEAPAEAVPAALPNEPAATTQAPSASVAEEEQKARAQGPTANNERAAVPKEELSSPSPMAMSEAGAPGKALPLNAPQPAKKVAPVAVELAESDADVNESGPSSASLPVAEQAEPSKPQTPPLPPENPEVLTPLRPADASTQNVPEKPSTGAVQAALAPRLMPARACVRGQTGASSATVVFGSSGAVQAVQVSGPAQGTPAEGCIKTALSSVRVGPFTRATFSVPLNIRPLE